MVVSFTQSVVGKRSTGGSGVSSDPTLAPLKLHLGNWLLRELRLFADGTINEGLEGYRI